MPYFDVDKLSPRSRCFQLWLSALSLLGRGRVIASNSHARKTVLIEGILMVDPGIQHRMPSITLGCTEARARGVLGGWCLRHAKWAAQFDDTLYVNK